MNLSEYYRFRLEQVTDEMYEKYLPHKDIDGKRFIYAPYPYLVDFVESYIAEVHDIVLELDDEELIDDENHTQTLVDCIIQIKEAYHEILNARRKFETKMSRLDEEEN